MSNHGKESINKEGVNIGETQTKIGMGKLITFSDIQMGNFGVVQTAFKLKPMLGQGTVLIEHLVVDKKTAVEHV
jgi:hypothetical protein